jgi:hypothetical protein
MGLCSIPCEAEEQAIFIVLVCDMVCANCKFHPSSITKNPNQLGIIPEKLMETT